MDGNWLIIDLTKIVIGCCFFQKYQKNFGAQSNPMASLFLQPYETNIS